MLLTARGRQLSGHRRAVSLAALVALTWLATGCVAAHLGAPTAKQRAPEILADADAEARALRALAEVYEDEAIDAYLSSIVDRLLDEAERATDARAITVTVLRDPALAAFALPTGDVFVHTGLLARVESEAQLAMILAREMTHVSLRWAAEPSRTPRAAAIAAIARTIGAAMGSPAGNEDFANAGLSPTFRAIVGQSLADAYAAAVEGYGPAAARAADAGAVGRLARASYDLTDATRVFDRLRRAARAGGAVERFFYGSDKALADSAEAITRLAGNAAASSETVAGETVADRFATAILPVLRENVALEVSAGRFRLAQEQVDRVVALAPDDARAHLMAGELYRLRAQRTRSVADRDDLARQALTSYQRCLELDPSMAEVQRGLGLLYYHFRQPERAREAFTRYIALRPDAPDAARVREYLAE